MTAAAVACAAVGVLLVVVGRRRLRNGAAQTNAPLLVGIFLVGFGLSSLSRWMW